MELDSNWKADWRFIFAYCGLSDEYLNNLFDEAFDEDMAHVFAKRDPDIIAAEFLRNWLKYQEDRGLRINRVLVG